MSYIVLGKIELANIYFKKLLTWKCDPQTQQQQSESENTHTVAKVVISVQLSSNQYFSYIRELVAGEAINLNRNILITSNVNIPEKNWGNRWGSNHSTSCSVSISPSLVWLSLSVTHHVYDV